MKSGLFHLFSIRFVFNSSQGFTDWGVQGSLVGTLESKRTNKNSEKRKIATWLILPVAYACLKD
jgi:hypothetical protein